MASEDGTVTEYGVQFQDWVGNLTVFHITQNLEEAEYMLTKSKEESGGHPEAYRLVMRRAEEWHERCDDILAPFRDKAVCYVGFGPDDNKELLDILEGYRSALSMFDLKMLRNGRDDRRFSCAIQLVNKWISKLKGQTDGE